MTEVWTDYPNLGHATLLFVTLLRLTLALSRNAAKWPDKSTTGYDMLDFKSHIKNCNGHISQLNFKYCKSMPWICNI